jgi:DNA-binding transcriptional MerR regulator
MALSPELPLQNWQNLRIGEVAAQTGLTARTIRYYEQIGLLPGGAERPRGRHRHYDADDVDRLRLIAGLRDLLGLSLDQLRELVAARGAWFVPERPWRDDESVVERMAVIDAALAQIDDQLAALRARAHALARLEHELLARRHAIESKRLT